MRTCLAGSACSLVALQLLQRPLGLQRGKAQARARLAGSQRPAGLPRRRPDSVPEARADVHQEDITQVCGKPKVIGKVYGGHDSVSGQWPWQASLLYLGQHLCGAVLIDAHWLLSTAQCFLNKSQAPQDYEVLLGNTQLYQHTQHTQKMLVNQIITHPDFEKLYVFGSDIAMLQLHLPVNFTPYVVPVCLPRADMQLPSQRKLR
ncbi:putative serine protease 47 isoform X1 [Ictidomys tridecemlineatus]